MIEQKLAAKRRPATSTVVPRLLVPSIYLIFISTTCAALAQKHKNHEQNSLEQMCLSCKLTGQSIDALIRRPRQSLDSSAWDQRARVDLHKLKKNVCRDIVSDAERELCREFFIEQQAAVEQWLEQHQRSVDQSKAATSFHDFVCIKQLKLCCPKGSFGPKCSKCAKCGPNYQCDGETTRTGTGECVCRSGHGGATCSSCVPGYYREPAKKSDAAAPADRQVVACGSCHPSCLYCRAAGPKGCEVCRKGYTWLPSYGCIDIDECIENKNICGKNTFCINTEGSHFCYECDRACDGCHGDGPDMCLKCAAGYQLDAKSGNCLALKRTILPPEANYYRYAIYIGLCACTCIIFHNNIYLASLIGLAVAAYIGCSEYIMSGHQQDLNHHSQHSSSILNELSHRYKNHDSW